MNNTILNVITIPQLSNTTSTYFTCLTTYVRRSLSELLSIMLLDVPPVAEAYGKHLARNLKYLYTRKPAIRAPTDCCIPCSHPSPILAHRTQSPLLRTKSLALGHVLVPRVAVVVHGVEGLIVAPPVGRGRVGQRDGEHDEDGAEGQAGVEAGGRDVCRSQLDTVPEKDEYEDKVGERGIETYS